jgi:hypothetical protein
VITNSGFSFNTGGSVTVSAAGSYTFDYDILANVAGSLGLTVNRSLASNTTFGRATGTTEIVGHGILTLNAGDVVTLVSSPTSTGPLTFTANPPQVIASLTLVALAAGTPGPTGATGPQGPAGPQGPQGATGLNGTAATISIGSTTTGAAGSSASVTNSGTTSAAVLNFTIPQGATGPAGPAAPTTIPFVCNSNCTEFGVEVIVPTPFPQFNNAALPPYTGGYAQVNDAPMGTAHGVIGIATGPDQGVIGGHGIASQQYYNAGQTVPVATSGIAYCQFDSQVVAGDYVTASPNNQGYCSGVGSNYALAASGSSGQLIGIALAENGLEDFGFFAAVPVLLNAGGAVR